MMSDAKALDSGVPDNSARSRNKGWFSKWRKRADSTAAETSSEVNGARKFSLFNDLSDELQLHVVSFVAVAPYEDSMCDQGRGATMTDILPLVSRKFRDMANSHTLWGMSLRRAIMSDKVWRRAAKVTSFDYTSTETTEVDYKALYKNMFDSEIALKLPVFIMGMDGGTIPNVYELYFFEPRYVYMIDRLLDKYQEWKESLQEDAEAPEPSLHFLHAHQGNFRFGCQDAGALLVKIVQSVRMSNGTYAVSLRVDALVSIERYWVEPNTGRLHYAYGRRIDLYPFN